ncbi:MAG: hypothetical protein J6S26_03220 [Solobacterium sp.]|nr:hypothetical protein [Solobacterium sp.]
MDNENTKESGIREQADNELEAASGGQGSAWDGMVLKKRYMEATSVNMKCNLANDYCDNFGCTYENPPKYPCPVCKSKNVCNRDPGVFRLMRVICYECGSFRDRSGGEPWGLGEASM